MIKLVEILKGIFCERKMASMPGNKTGLPHKVFVSQNDPKNKHHRPRLKLISTDGANWSVTFDGEIQVIEGDHSKINSKEWKSIVNWITLNKQGLHDTWDGKLHPKQFLNSSTAVKE